MLLTYEHAFTLDPNNAEASALSAGVLLELGRYEEALAKCDLSLAISPDQVEALCVKGDCLHNLGRNCRGSGQLSAGIRVGAGPCVCLAVAWKSA